MLALFFLFMLVLSISAEKGAASIKKKARVVEIAVKSGTAIPNPQPRDSATEGPVGAGSTSAMEPDGGHPTGLNSSGQAPLNIRVYAKPSSPAVTIRHKQDYCGDSVVVKGREGFNGYIGGIYKYCGYDWDDHSCYMKNTDVDGITHYIYYLNAEQRWYIGRTLGSTVCYAYTDSTASEPYEADTYWEVTDGKAFTTDTQITISCEDFTPCAGTLTVSGVTGVKAALLNGDYTFEGSFYGGRPVYSKSSSISTTGTVYIYYFVDVETWYGYWFMSPILGSKAHYAQMKTSVIDPTLITAPMYVWGVTWVKMNPSIYCGGSASTCADYTGDCESYAGTKSNAGDIECADAECTDDECCYYTCALGNGCISSMQLRSNADEIELTDNVWTSDQCCVGKCAAFKCPTNMQRKPNAASAVCSSKTCTAAQCCVLVAPKCGTYKCGTGKMVKPSAKSSPCTNRKCTAAQCCTGSCSSISKCPSGSQLKKNRVTIACAKMTCTSKDCCVSGCPSGKFELINFDNANVDLNGLYATKQGLQINGKPTYEGVDVDYCIYYGESKWIVYRCSYWADSGDYYAYSTSTGDLLTAKNWKLSDGGYGYEDSPNAKIACSSA